MWIQSTSYYECMSYDLCCIINFQLYYNLSYDYDIPIYYNLGHDSHWSLVFDIFYKMTISHLLNTTKETCGYNRHSM